MADYTKAELDAPTRALLDYCVKLTRRMNEVGEADITALRAAGWTDEQIHDAVQVTGFFNYYTRLAEGLGVDDEDFFPPRVGRRSR